jgi:competence protein ComGC
MKQLMIVPLKVLITTPQLRIMTTMPQMMQQQAKAQHKGKNVPLRVINQIIMGYHISQSQLLSLMHQMMKGKP